MAVCPSCGDPTPHNGPCPNSLNAQVSPPQAEGWTARSHILQGRYEIIGRLGQGGMGTVYMARDQRLANRACVVKKLRDDFFRLEDQKKAEEMFEREAHVLSQLDHPNIVHVLDYFEEEDGYFLVMEYVEGRDLSTILQQRQSPFEESQVVDWACQICDVLEYLHEHDPPVIYRDLKPSNIMFDVKGRVKLVDFGIARAFDPGSEGTHVVSAGYSPPEQYWGEADTRSDVYSLGATCYYLLTGVQPEALHSVSPKLMNPQVSLALDQVVLKATAQNPLDRYQSAKEMKAALRSEAGRKAKRKAPIEAAILIGLVLFTCLAFFAYMRFEELLRKQSEDEQVKDALNSKLKSFSRAQEAEQKAIDEWRLESKQFGGQDKANATNAVEETSEQSLTDPAGLPH